MSKHGLTSGSPGLSQGSGPKTPDPYTYFLSGLGRVNGSGFNLDPLAIVRAKPRKTLEMTIPINSHLWFNPISAAKGFKAFQVIVSLYLSLFFFFSLSDVLSVWVRIIMVMKNKIAVMTR